MQNSFGAYIRKAREALVPPKSQAQLAKRAGVTPAHLCDIEQDRRRPSAGVARRLAKLLKLEPSEVLARAGVLTPKALELLRNSPKLVAKLNLQAVQAAALERLPRAA